MHYELHNFTYVCRHTNHVVHDQKDQGLYSPTILQNVLGVVLYNVTQILIGLNHVVQIYKLVEKDYERSGEILVNTSPGLSFLKHRLPLSVF